MAVKAFSSVSVIDYTDIGNIQLYLTSNQPTTVIYDPNTTGTAAYSPNWASSNLKVTPVITYNGTNLALTTSGLEITFKRKVGSATATDLITGEAVSSGILTVSANTLSTTNSLLTYVCSVSYTDPEIGVPITTEASLTYTLLSMATELKSCEITGDSVFLYDSDRAIVGASTITLSSILANVNVSQWQYKNSSGQYVAYPITTANTSNAEETLVVSASDNVFNGRTASIKLVSDDSDIYDVHVITKIYDGAKGTDTVSAVLTNENHYLPCDSNGTVKSWTGSATQIYIYEAGEDTTSSWTITPNEGTGLTGTFDAATATYTPTALDDDTSYVDFVCTKAEYSTIIKRFTLTKVQQGQDGEDAVIYECTANSYTLNLNESNVFTPSTVTFYGYYTKGNTTVRSLYAGRFKIYESTNGTTFEETYSSASNQSSYVYTPSSENVMMIKCELYKAGGTTTLLDSQTVLITKDGASGEDGNDGLNGISMGLGNYQDVIPCNTSNKASASKTINIPFYAYAGIARIPVTATVGTLPSGVTVTSNTAGTTSANGLLVLTVASGATFGSTSAMSGEITITLQATYNSQTQSLEQKFTWTKNKQASNGTSAVILQIYSADGGVIRNSAGSTTLATQLTSGTTTVTSGVTYVWKKYVSGEYETISGETASTLEVIPSMVDDLAFFKCEATYNSKTYSAYYTVDDITDPYVAYTYSTITQFKNSQGFGAIYTRVYQANNEVDPILSTTFSDTAPSSPTTGDYYYHLDSSAKTCTLKQYSGSKWTTVTENNIFNYNYYRIDKSGNSLDSTAWKTTRAFYVDPSMIDGRMQFVCEVTSNDEES